MLRAYARFGLPVLLSTGMGTLEDVRLAAETLNGAGARDVTILHCTSLYPAPPAALNLRAMTTMAKALGRPVGYSDHSLDDHAAIAAVALGACVVEKHFTLDRALPGPDHKASLEPQAFAAMVRRIREVEAMLGDGVKRPAPGEAEVAALVRRSWHAVRPLEAGRVVEEADIRLMRPAAGLPPTMTPVGRRVARPVAAGAPIVAEDLAP
jgi:sialic acid synthase SpsE